MTRGNTAPLRNKNGQSFPGRRERVREETREVEAGARPPGPCKGRLRISFSRERREGREVLQPAQTTFLKLPLPGVGHGLGRDAGSSCCPQHTPRTLPPSPSLLRGCESVSGAPHMPGSSLRLPHLGTGHSVLELPVDFSVTWLVCKLCEDKGPRCLVPTEIPRDPNGAELQQAFSKHLQSSHRLTECARCPSGVLLLLS